MASTKIGPWDTEVNKLIRGDSSLILEDPGLGELILQIDGTEIQSWTIDGIQLFDSGPRINLIIDDDTMALATANSLSTSESIKAYVDNSILANTLDKIEEGDSYVEVVDTGTGKVDIYVDGSQVGQYLAAGLAITGILTSDGLVIGDSETLLLGSIGRILSDGSGIKIGNATETFLYMTPDGAVDLYYDNTKEGETVSGALKATNALQIGSSQLLNAVSGNSQTIVTGSGSGTQHLAVFDASNNVVEIASDITTLELEELSDGSVTTLHDHDVTGLTNWPTIDYAYVSGNDAATDVTASELEQLTDGSDASALHTHTLNTITNPNGDKTFNMTTRQLGFLWTNPSGNPLELTASGAYSGAVLHIHQHTGNPGTGTHLLELEAEDTDVHLSNFEGANANIVAIHFTVSGDTHDSAGYGRLEILAGGKMSWGAGGASAVDTNLYRSASDTLKTDDNFQAAGGIDASAIGANTPSTIVGTTIDATTNFTIGGMVITDNNITTTPGDTVSLKDDDGDIMASFASNGAVTLYHNNTINLYTSGTGVYAGDGTDYIHLQATGSASYIDPTGTLSIRNSGGTETMATFEPDGAVSLYHDNSIKLVTTNVGATLTGVLTCDGVTMDDNEDITLGTTSVVYSDATSFVVDGVIASAVTLNDSDKASGLSLSGGDLTVTKITSNARNMVRATTSFNTGKRYYEYTVDARSSQNQCFGWADVSHDLTQHVGLDSNDRGLGYFTAGRFYQFNSYGGGTSYGQGDTVMTAIDFDAGKVWFGKNGTWEDGDPSTGTGHQMTFTANDTLFPAVSLYQASDHVGTVAFTEASFSYSVPSGFTAVDTGAGTGNMIVATPDGSVDLYYSATKVFGTRENGINVFTTADGHAGNLTMGATALFLFPDEDGDTVQIGGYESSGSTYVTMADFDPDGQVDLYHNDNLRFSTTNAGATLVGTLTSDGLILGAGEDLAFGTAAVLYDDGSSLVIANSADTETLAKFTTNGACELYYDNIKEAETVSGALKATNGLVVAASGITVDDVNDEDDMASDSATALATQQSIKAYVDNGILGKNLIINGDMRVNQRDNGSGFTSATDVTNDDDTWCMDRWLLLSDGNDIIDITKQSGGGVNGNEDYQRLDVETIQKKFGIFQVIENKNCLGALDGTVSLSFEARVSNASKLSDIRAVVLSWDGAADTVTSDIVSAWNAEGARPTYVANWTAENVDSNLSVTDSWARYEIENISIDTAGATNIGVFIYQCNVATNDTAGVFLEITNVQLEGREISTDFERRKYDQELQLCKRYCQKYDYDDAGANSPIGFGMVTGTTTAQCGAINMVEKFSVPTLYCADHTLFRINYQSGGVNVDTGGLSIGTASRWVVRINVTVASANLTGGEACFLRANSANALLLLEAEL